MGEKSLDLSQLKQDEAVIFRTSADPERRYVCEPFEFEAKVNEPDSRNPDRPKVTFAELKADDSRKSPLVAEACGKLAVGNLFTMNFLDSKVRGKLTLPGEVIAIEDRAA